MKQEWCAAKFYARLVLIYNICYGMFLHKSYLLCWMTKNPCVVWKQFVSPEKISPSSCNHINVKSKICP